MNFDYVIFDFDGTIADTRDGVYASIIYALESFGLDVPDESVLEKFLGPPLVSGFMDNVGVSEELACHLVEKYRELYTDNAMYLLKLFDGVEQLLSDLKQRGVMLAIASSKPQHFFDRLLNHLGITHFFDAVCGASMDDRGNGKKEIILSAAEKLGCRDKNRVLMVGDRSFDILGAKEAGVKSAGVLYGFGSPEELSSCGADFLAESPQDIMNIVCG